MLKTLTFFLISRQISASVAGLPFPTVEILFVQTLDTQFLVNYSKVNSEMRRDILKGNMNMQVICTKYLEVV